MDEMERVIFSERTRKDICDGMIFIFSARKG